jgi:hypothetical protein
MISRQEILGAWTLISYEVRAIDGTLVEYPFGDDAQGFLIYTEDGYMSAQLMRRHRPPYDHPTSAGGTTEQSAAAARGYLAYSGPFDLDEATGIVRHHASVSLYPNWVGGDQIRPGDLRDGRLTLVADVKSESGSRARATLTWGRPV